MQEALSYYDKLKQFRPHGKLDSMHFTPALLYYELGGSENLAKAKSELEVLVRRGRGALYVPALFWLGRLYEEADDEDLARKSREYFERIIEYDGKGMDKIIYYYYAIRARMHLNFGKRASMLLFPDEETERDLKDMYVGSRPRWRDHDDRKACPHGGRVSWAVWTGLYAKALEGGRDKLTRRGVSIEQRRDTSFLADLPWGVLPSVAIHVALRQDAVRAARTSPNKVASYAWQVTQAGDPAGGLDVLAAHTRWWELVATVFPPVHVRLLRESSKEHGVPPELLYGVVRWESRFSPAAVSREGALGLFQFLPSTFDELNKRWNLQDDAHGGALEGYLSEPKASVELGARWFGELVGRWSKGANAQRTVLAVMEHHAGREAVNVWLSRWTAAGREMDVEYMLEGARIRPTRNYVKQVVATMAIARAARMFPQNDG